MYSILITSDKNFNICVSFFHLVSGFTHQHVMFCRCSCMPYVLLTKQAELPSPLPLRIGAVRAQTRRQTQPHTITANNASATFDTVYRAIAYRSRQNGRSNQGAQRQNPVQPGRGLLLLNPLVFTRETEEEDPRRCDWRLRKSLESEDMGRACTQCRQHEEMLREYWLTMLPPRRLLGPGL